MSKTNFVNIAAEHPTINDVTDRESWLKLSFLDLTPVKLAKLLKIYKSEPGNILGADFAELKLHGLKDIQLERLRIELAKDRTVDLDSLSKRGIRMLTLENDSYPERLKTIVDPPPILFIRGELMPDDQYSVAIVGSRRAGAYGLSIARKFGHDLACGGLCIVSGGALGIDTESHVGAIEAGGRTLGVFGCGLDRHYPQENAALFERIASEKFGALISEYPPGITPEPWHFPARNRIISGLSIGVLVIECPVKSGAMITAHEAADQGRDVMAIPGGIDTGLSAGCHQLIQQGAKLVQSVEDVFEELGILKLKADVSVPVESDKSMAPERVSANLTPIQQRIVSQLSLDPKTLDQISDGAGLSAHEVSSTLTILELNKIARKIGGQGFVRVL